MSSCHICFVAQLAALKRFAWNILEAIQCAICCTSLAAIITSRECLRRVQTQTLPTFLGSKFCPTKVMSYMSHERKPYQKELFVHKRDRVQKSLQGWFPTRDFFFLKPRTGCYSAQAQRTVKGACLWWPFLSAWLPICTLHLWPDLAFQTLQAKHPEKSEKSLLVWPVFKRMACSMRELVEPLLPTSRWRTHNTSFIILLFLGKCVLQLGASRKYWQKYSRKPTIILQFKGINCTYLLALSTRLLALRPAALALGNVWGGTYKKNFCGGRTLPAQCIACRHEHQNQSKSNNHQSAPFPITNYIDWTQHSQSPCCLTQPRDLFHRPIKIFGHCAICYTSIADSHHH